ncbi:MAG TPA: acyl-CoA dehydrogenase family protein [Stellaceae bacterium]|nr:acyl-CoA dehydrogenase family protein [Stellaceae bacterium]
MIDGVVVPVQRQEGAMGSAAAHPADDGHPGRVYLDRARELGPTIAAAAAALERRRELPEPLVAALVQHGLFRLLLPRSLGGAELPPAAYVPVIEEVARHDASVAWCLGQACGCSMTAAHLTPEAAREIFGGERGIVAWGPPGSPAEARSVPGGYRLSGSWSFASGSHHAGWLGAHVTVCAADGSPRLRPDGSPMFRTLLFPKAHAEMTDIWHVIGLRGTGSDSYRVTDLFVPEAHSVERGSATAPREPGVLYAFSSSNVYSAGFAGVALGIARASLDAFVELARDKIPRGAQQTLRDNHVIQAQVAQAAARIGAARAFLLGGLDDIWHEAETTGRLSLDHNTTIRLASTWAIHQAKDAVDTLYHAAGATAIFEDNPFERRFRDIHTVIQQYQGRQAHFESVGQVLLGLAAENTMFTF